MVFCLNRLFCTVPGIVPSQRRPIEYERRPRRTSEPLAEPRLYLSRLVKEIGIRKLNRQGFGRWILETISRRKRVKASTLQEYQRGIEQYALTFGR